jgi:hypothetical protein
MPIRIGNSNLRGHGGLGRCPSRAERRADPIAGVFEQPTAVSIDRARKDFVMGDECGAHRLGVALPAARRALDIGEQGKAKGKRVPRGRTPISAALRPCYGPLPYDMEGAP